MRARLPAPSCARAQAVLVYTNLIAAWMLNNAEMTALRNGSAPADDGADDTLDTSSPKPTGLAGKAASH